MARDLIQRAEHAVDPAVAREALEAATRAANDRIWVRRNAARIYREQLGDPAAARRVLEELEPLTGVEWRLTAAAWSELGDRARAIDCLERAAANARTSGDLCTVALGYRDCGFADEGRLLVDGARSIASHALELWTVANACTAFGDDGRAVLESGLRDTVQPLEILTLAHALAVYGADAETVSATLARAEDRASTVDGWLAIAVSYQQLLDDEARALACISAASQLAIGSHHERAIAIARARAGVLPLLDDELPRLPPHQLLRAGARSIGCTRDPARLLGWLRSRMTRVQLDALSRAGTHMFQDDVITLLEIQRAGTLPHPLPGYFSHFAEVALGHGPGADRMICAFACTLLVIDGAAGLAVPDHAGTLAMLLACCLELGDAAVEGAVALFAALADAYEASHLASHLVLFAELGLALALAWLDPSDPRIDAAIDRLIRDEPRFRARARAPRPRWLLGLAPRDGGLPGQTRIWSTLAGETLEHPRQQRLRERLIP